MQLSYWLLYGRWHNITACYFDFGFSGRDRFADHFQELSKTGQCTVHAGRLIQMQDHKPAEKPKAISDRVARSFFRVEDDELSRERAVYQFLLSAVECAIIIPILFYLRFGEISPFAWGVTVFFVVYCLVVAFGFYFSSRTEYHTTVPSKGNWADKIGAWWLMACAFGPFFGWIATTGTIPITPGTWHWLYGARVFLTVVLPIVCALPLLRYARGKAALIALPLLLVITLLPVSAGVNSARDLWGGPTLRPTGRNSQTEIYLPHTERVLQTNR